MNVRKMGVKEKKGVAKVFKEKQPRKHVIDCKDKDVGDLIFKPVVQKGGLVYQEGELLDAMRQG